MNPGERNALVIFIGRIVGAGVSIGYVIIIPRVLEPQGYGYYAFWFAQLFLLFTLFDLGGSEILRRYLPGMLARNDGQARTLVSRLRLAKLAIVPAACVLAFGYEAPGYYLLVVLAGVFATYSWIYSDVNFAASRMVRYSLYHLLRKVVRFVLLLVLFVLFAEPGIIAALLITEVAVLALFYILTRDALPPGRARLDIPFRRYLWFGILVYGAGLVMMSVGRLPVIIGKGADLSFAELGFLALAIDITFFALRELFFGIGEAVQPIQVVDYAEGRTEKLARSFHIAQRYTLLVMLPSLSLLAVFVTPILTLIGPDFIPARPYLLVSLPVTVFVVLGSLQRQAMIVAERKEATLAAACLALGAFAVVLTIEGRVGGLALAWSVLAGTVAHYFCTLWISRDVLLWTGSNRADVLKLITAAVAFHLIAFGLYSDDWSSALIAVAAASAAYFALLAGLRVVGSEEIELGKRIIWAARRW